MDFCVQHKKESRQASQQHIQAHISLCAVPIVCWYFFRELWLHLKYDPFHHCTMVASEFEFGSLFKSSRMGRGVHIWEIQHVLRHLNWSWEGSQQGTEEEVWVQIYHESMINLHATLGSLLIEHWSQGGVHFSPCNLV